MKPVTAILLGFAIGFAYSASSRADTAGTTYDAFFSGSRAYLLSEETFALQFSSDIRRL